MNSLLSIINKSADEYIVNEETEKMIDENLEYLREGTQLSVEQLNEAISNWIARAKNGIRDGKMSPSQKQNAAAVFAALLALTNKHLEGSYNASGDLGKILSDISGDDPQADVEATKKLRNMGLSSETYLQQATQAVENPGAINKFATMLQAKIEPVMNRNLSQETARKSQPKPMISPSDQAADEVTTLNPDF